MRLSPVLTGLVRGDPEMEESRVPGIDDLPIPANVPAEDLYHALMVHDVIIKFHEFCLLSCRIPLARGAETRYNCPVVALLLVRVSAPGERRYW